FIGASSAASLRRPHRLDDPLRFSEALDGKFMSFDVQEHTKWRRVRGPCVRLVAARAGTAGDEVGRRNVPERCAAILPQLHPGGGGWCRGGGRVLDAGNSDQNAVTRLVD